MKKKLLSILLVVVLCASVVLGVAACDLLGGGDKGGDKGGKGGDVAGVSASDIAEMKTTLENYVTSWLKAHAEEEGNVSNQKATLKGALTGQEMALYDADDNELDPTFTVSYDSSKQQYTVTASWAQGKIKHSFTKDAQVVNYGSWAGKYSRTSGYTFSEVDEDDDTSGAAGILDTIANALFTTVNKTYADAKKANPEKVDPSVINATAKLGFDIMGVKGYLNIRGNFDIAEDGAPNTQLAFEVCRYDNDKVLGGVYFEGAETSADCKLYIRYYENDAEVYKYLDYMDIHKLVYGIIAKANAKKTNAAAAEGPLPTGTLGEILEEFGVSDTISGMVGGIVNMVAEGYYLENDDDTTSYIIDINLGAAVSTLSSSLGSLASTVSTFLEKLPAPLNTLDIATMNGLLGHITIAATVGGADEDELTDFELAVNIPKCDFYLNDDDDTDPIAIPAINGAITIEDFSLAADGDAIDDIIPNKASEADPINLLNFNFGGDITINHKNGNVQAFDKTYSFSFMSDVNLMRDIVLPIVVGDHGEAKASLYIYETDNQTEIKKRFLSIAYDQDTAEIVLGGKLLNSEGDETVVYPIQLNDAGFAQLKSDAAAWIGLADIFPDGKFTTPAAQKAHESDIGKIIMTEIWKIWDTSDKGGEPSELDVNDIIDGGKSAFNEGKTLVKSLIENKTIVFDTEKNIYKIEVNKGLINQVTGIINRAFGTGIPQIDLDINVKLFYNYKDAQIDTTGKFLATVDVLGMNFELTVDPSAKATGLIVFKMTRNTRVYTCTISVPEGKFAVNFVIATAEGATVTDTTVTFSDFFFKWGGDNARGIRALIDADTNTKGLFVTGGAADTLLDGVLYLIGYEETSPLYSVAANAIPELVSKIASFFAKK